MTFNYESAVKAIADLLVAVGEDPHREGLRETPARVAHAWQELLAGLEEDPAKHLEKQFTVETDEMILVRDIKFHSVCEHHLLPFYGYAHVAYLPQNNKVTGLSKLARVVEGYAKRPQVQERLTTQIAEALMQKLNPLGACVIIEAEHLCMSARGIKQPGTSTVTSKFCGQMNNPGTRQEMLTILLSSKH